MKITQKSLLHYDVKILLALLESVKGSKKFFLFLLNNGYPELAAWSNVMRGDEEALKWLFEHKYTVLAMMTIAIDGHDKARTWVLETKDDFLINFTAACRKDRQAMKWLEDNGLQIFLEMALEEQRVLEIQAKDQMFFYKWRK